MTTKYEVQTDTICDGWVNGWSDEDGASQYDTIAEAQAAIDDHIESMADAYENGYMGYCEDCGHTGQPGGTTCRVCKRGTFPHFCEESEREQLRIVPVNVITEEEKLEAIFKPVTSPLEAKRWIEGMFKTNQGFHLDDSAETIIGMDGKRLFPDDRIAKIVNMRVEACRNHLGSVGLDVHAVSMHMVHVEKAVRGEPCGYNDYETPNSGDYTGYTFTEQTMMAAQCLIEHVFYGRAETAYEDWDLGIYEFRDRVTKLATFVDALWKFATNDGELFCDFDADFCERILLRFMQDGMQNAELIDYDRGMLYALEIQSEIIEEQ